ncbi:MAG TPA: TetR family transcriptional regulator [Holophaga sp.]|nr:TetR family transcriptional regulator [Holophaga sp.]
MQRARQPHQKAARREAILSAALDLLAEIPFSDISMNLVAERAGLVKGTLYLYFATREALFLDVLRGQLHAWLWDLESGLEGLPRTGRAAAAAALIAESLASRPRLRGLMAALPVLLGRELPESAALAFRNELQARTEAMGSRLERALGSLAPGQGAHLFFQVQAMAAGLQVLSERSPQGADPEQELQAFLQAQLEDRRRSRSAAKPA